MTGDQTSPGNSASVIGFYGWKGGGGRTLLVGNLALALALSGMRVLAIDLDLEAPGLGDYFDRFVTSVPDNSKSFLSDGGWRNRQGFLDLLNIDAKDQDNLVSELGRALQNACVVAQSPGQLDFLGTMKHPGSERYAYGMLQAGWDRFFADFGGAVIDQLKPQLLSSYDAILVDLRTGLSQFTFQIFARMIDRLVIVTPATHQAARGISTAADIFAFNRPEVPCFVALSDLHADCPPAAEGASQRESQAGTTGGDGGAGPPLTGSAEGVIALALHRLLRTEEKATGRKEAIGIGERLFRLPRLDTQQGSEALLYTLPPPATGARTDADSRVAYGKAMNGLASALGLGEPFDAQRLVQPADPKDNKVQFGNASAAPASNGPTPGIIQAVVSNTITAIEAYLKSPAQPKPDEPDTGKGSPEERLRDAIRNASYELPDKRVADPFGVRPLLAARLAQPFLSRAAHNGDTGAAEALRDLGLDVLEPSDVETAHAACRALVTLINPDWPGLQTVRSGADQAAVDATDASTAGQTAEVASGAATDPQADPLSPAVVAQAIEKAEAESRTPWKALHTLAALVPDGAGIGPADAVRLAEVRAILLSNAEDHVGALKQLLTLPQDEKDRAHLQQLKGRLALAAQFSGAIGRALTAIGDRLAIGTAPADDDSDTLCAAINRLDADWTVARYREALACLGDPDRFPSRLPDLDPLRARQDTGAEFTHFDDLMVEVLKGTPPDTLREQASRIDDPGALSPRNRASLHSALGEPTRAYGALLEVARLVRSPNTALADNPLQLSALRDVAVLAVRGGAVDAGFQLFDQMLGEIPELFATGAERKDSWVEDDAQFERRRLLLYRAHCHWMAGNLKAARDDLEQARKAQQDYEGACTDGRVIRPLPALHRHLEARLALDDAKFAEAQDISQPLIQVYRALVPVEGQTAVERLAGIHRLRARAFRCLRKDHEAREELAASLAAASLAPEGNPGPDADRAEAELLQLCWAEARHQHKILEGFARARDAIVHMITHELPDGLLFGPEESSFQARIITLAMDCIEAIGANETLTEDLEARLSALKKVPRLKPLHDRLKRRWDRAGQTAESGRRG